MRRIAASCSILTPRLDRRWRRAAWLGLATAMAGAGVYQIAREATLCTGPSLACAIALLAWIAARLPATRAPGDAANDNHAMPSTAWPKPRLRAVASPDREIGGAGR